MLIYYKYGDIFRCDAEAIVNPVNCDGIMDNELALAYKRKYPRMYNAYLRWFNEELLEPGNVYPYQIDTIECTIWVINFTTKNKVYDRTRYEWIENGLVNLRKLCNDYDIKSIAIPKLGCELGRLDWRIVNMLIKRHLKDDERTVYHIFGRDTELDNHSLYPIPLNYKV